jgi:hypothetical protein
MMMMMTLTPMKNWRNRVWIGRIWRSKLYWMTVEGGIKKPMIVIMIIVQTTQRNAVINPVKLHLHHPSDDPQHRLRTNFPEGVE